MAAGAMIPYTEFLFRLARQEFDFLSGTIKAALLDSSYGPNADDHKVFGDVSGDEIADGDYAQVTLSSKTIQIKNGLIVFDFENIDFGSSVTISAKYCIIYLDGATDYLMGYIDLDTSSSSNVSSTNSNFQVNPNAFGLFGIDPYGSGVSSGE